MSRMGREQGHEKETAREGLLAGVTFVVAVINSGFSGYNLFTIKFTLFRVKEF